MLSAILSTILCICNIVNTIMSPTDLDTAILGCAAIFWGAMALNEWQNYFTGRDKTPKV